MLIASSTNVIDSGLLTYRGTDIILLQMPSRHELGNDFYKGMINHAYSHELGVSNIEVKGNDRIASTDTKTPFQLVFYCC